VKSKLEHSGYATISAEDGQAGLDKIRQEKPDLILLDIILPQKNGFDVLEEMNSEKIDIPVIIISNSGQPVEIDRAKKLGVRDYLIKADFSPSEVIDKVIGVVGPGDKQEEGQKKEKTAAASLPKQDSGGSSPGKHKVLVVEDDEFLRQLVCQKLMKENFEVDAAIDSTGVFQVLENKKPDLILLDLILPGMDGFEILKRIKQNKDMSDVPVIVLSNLGQAEDIDRAMAGGAEDYMVKANFTPGEIVEKIRFILQKNKVN
jgi:DNA-binding response OmpR family regulator